MLAGDVIEVSADFENGFGGFRGNGGEVPQEGPKDVGASGQIAAPEAIADQIG